MTDRPNIMMVATRLAERFRAAWPDGVFVDHPSTAKSPLEYAQQVMQSDRYVEGGTVEAALDRPADGNGSGVPRVYTIIASAFLSCEHTRLGATPSTERFGLMTDAMVRSVEDDLSLGYAEPDWCVEVQRIENLTGFLRLPGGAAEFHYAPYRYTVWATRTPNV